MSNLLLLKKIFKWYLIVGLILILLGLLSLISTWLIGNESEFNSFLSFFEYFLKRDFLIYSVVGFLAQIIDGALGMAYGISSTSFLMSTGVSPVVASTSVHIAEVFTTGISGLSHWRFGNVNKVLFKKLAIPGAIGAALGAYVLISFDGDMIKPFVAIYLIVMGIVIIGKAFKKTIIIKNYRKVGWLALVGGFLDASGGGGWGPVVTSTLISKGNNPRLIIGTVSAVEFIVALTASGIFTIFVGVNSWLVIAGLIFGGAIAAPLGAFITHKINARIAMTLVGLLIIFLSIRTLLLNFNLL